MLTRGSLHGYAIGVAIESRSEDVLPVEEGSLYPALHRLELAGMPAEGSQFKPASIAYWPAIMENFYGNPPERPALLD